MAKKDKKKDKKKSKSKKESDASASEAPKDAAESSTKVETDSVFSPEFEAGLLFESMGLKNNLTASAAPVYNSNVHRNPADQKNERVQLEPLQFQQMFAKLKNLASSPRARAQGVTSGLNQAESFEAGRLFARYDRSSTGRLSKAEFAKMFRDMQSGTLSSTLNVKKTSSEDFFNFSSSSPPRRSEDMAEFAAATNALNRGVGLHASSNNPFGVPLNTSSDQNRQSFGFNRSTRLEDMHGGDVFPTSIFLPPSFDDIGLGGGGVPSASSYEQLFLRSISGKKTAVLQQLQAVQSRMAEVQGMRRAIEQETLQEYEPIIRRLRAAEAHKLSILQRNVDELRSDMQSLDHAQQQVFSNRSMQDLIRLYPRLVDLIQKPLSPGMLNVTPDLNREAAVRAQKVQRYDTAIRMLKTKDQMLWLLIRERNSLRKAAGLPLSHFSFPVSVGGDPEERTSFSGRRESGDGAILRERNRNDLQEMQREQPQANELEELSKDFCAEMEYMTTEVERLDSDLRVRDSLLEEIAKATQEGNLEKISEILKVQKPQNRKKVTISPVLKADNILGEAGRGGFYSDSDVGDVDTKYMMRVEETKGSLRNMERLPPRNLR
eukprot:g2190.t1